MRSVISPHCNPKFDEVEEEDDASSSSLEADTGVLIGCGWGHLVVTSAEQSFFVERHEATLHFTEQKVYSTVDRHFSFSIIEVHDLLNVQ